MSQIFGKFLHYDKNTINACKKCIYEPIDWFHFHELIDISEISPSLFILRAISIGLWLAGNVDSKPTRARTQHSSLQLHLASFTKKIIYSRKLQQESKLDQSFNTRTLLRKSSRKLKNKLRYAMMERSMTFWNEIDIQYLSLTSTEYFTVLEHLLQKFHQKSGDR